MTDPHYDRLRERIAEVLRERISEIHQPVTEEAEIWADGVGADRHAELFPDCIDCEGHTIAMEVCSECGYSHDGEQPLYRAWPCPTIRAALGREGTP
jgi:hypothetical protein